jgi:hypothetical protein
VWLLRSFTIRVIQQGTIVCPNLYMTSAKASYENTTYGNFSRSVQLNEHEHALTQEQLSKSFSHVIVGDSEAR